MCAHAWLAVTVAASRPARAAPGGGPGAGGRAREGRAARGRLPRQAGGRNQVVTGGNSQLMICLTVSEIRRLHAILSRPAHSAAGTCTAP